MLLDIIGFRGIAFEDGRLVLVLVARAAALVRVVTIGLAALGDGLSNALADGIGEDDVVLGHQGFKFFGLHLVVLFVG